MGKKNPTDPNVLAAQILGAATGQPSTPPSNKKKNPAAVALGRLGGLKCGKARADIIYVRKRRQIAKQ